MAEKGNLKPILGVSRDMQMLRSFVPEFRDHGYGIVHAVDIEVVESILDKFRPGIVLLDEEVEGHYPEDYAEQKVIAILKEGSDPDHRAEVMESGVEGYVIKPVVPSHLRWILQKAEPPKEKRVYEKDGLSINLTKYLFTYKGNAIHFARSEVLMLTKFLEEDGIVVPREELADLFNDGQRVSGLRGAKTHMQFVTKIFEKNGIPMRFKNIRGAGWKLITTEQEPDVKE